MIAAKKLYKWKLDKIVRLQANFRYKITKLKYDDRKRNI